MAPVSRIANGRKPCSKCKEVLLIRQFSTTGKKVDGSPKYNSWCKACIKAKQASYHKRTWGPERLHYTALKRTKSARAYLTYLLGKARRRNACSVSVDDIERMWSEQGGRCALSGFEMTMKLGKGVTPTNASIDRIDSTKSYTKDNVQLVCRAVNVAKSDLTTKVFLELCAAITHKANNG